MTQKIIAIVAAVLGSVAAVIAIANYATNGLAGSNHGADSTTSTGQPWVAPTTPATAKLAATVLPPASGSSEPDSRPHDDVPAKSCLGADGSAAPCNAPHRYEVVDPGGQDCAAAALRYAGADPGLDVTNLEPASGPVGASSFACALTVSDGNFQQPMGDVLSTPTGDQFRKCMAHTTVDRQVSCAEPHTREYFTLPPGTAPDQPNCDQAADRYLNLKHEQLADLLRIVPLPYSDLGDGQPRCAVEVRGDDVLTASLRANGTKALPLQPAS